MRWWCLAPSLLVLAGCRGLFGLADPLPGDPGDAATADGVGDAGTDSVALCNASNLSCSGTTVAYACGNDCWVGCSESVTASVMAQRCNAWNGKPAEFKSMSDQQCFREYIQPTDDAWTGLGQMTGSAAVADGWTWNGDLSPPSFFNWAGGQPDDGDGAESNAEQCASIIDGTDKWQDVPCGATFTFACVDELGGD